MSVTAPGDTKLLEEVRAQPRPAHVAIIMDGNGRWATARGLPRIAGHREGVKTARAIVRAADAIGLRYLTLYDHAHAPARGVHLPGASGAHG
jgi:undecaprenyl diphosphate synthase